jgi:hypothetical protein
VRSGPQFATELLTDFVLKKPDDDILFALCVLLVPCFTSFPDILSSHFEPTPKLCLITALALSKCDCDAAFAETVSNFFWRNSRILPRIRCRVMFHVLNSKELPATFVQTECQRIIEKIGKSFISFHEDHMKVASDMIWILRRILVERTSARDILIEVMSGIPGNKDELLSGLFAVLGSTIENVRSYANIRYHTSRSSVLEGVAIPGSATGSILVYEKPFDIRRQSILLSPPFRVNIYAVPLLNLDSDAFPQFDFLLSFFSRFIQNPQSITAVLYLQAFAHYLTFPTFLGKIGTAEVQKLSIFSLPFHTVYLTWLEAQAIQTIQRVPVNSGFSQLFWKPPAFTSYVSPQLEQGDLIVHVSYSVEGSDLASYFGVVSDTVVAHFTRFFLIAVPSGEAFPFKQRLEPFNDPREVSFEINTKNRTIGYQKSILQYALGNAVRILIATKHSATVRISVQEDRVFQLEPVPEVKLQAGIYATNTNQLYHIPDRVKRFKSFPIAAEWPDCPISLVAPVTSIEKFMNKYIEPPGKLSIHLKFARHASDPIVKDMLRGLFMTLSLQLTTVCLMRIIPVKPEICVNPLRLFVLLMVPLEPFLSSVFADNRFPFPLTTPVWENSNLIYLGLEADARRCLKTLIEQPQTRRLLCQGLEALCQSRYMHLVVYPHPSHQLFYAHQYSPVIQVRSKLAILAPNSFEPLMVVFSHTSKRQEYFPMIISHGTMDLMLDQSITRTDLSLFTISSADNSWVFDTAFESLLIMKNLLFVLKTPDERTQVKSAFVDIFLAQSPLVIRYLAEIAEHIQQQLTPCFFDNKDHYRHRLIVLGSFLKNRPLDSLSSYLDQEIAALGLQSSIEIMKFFPEWVIVEVDSPSSPRCPLPATNLNPGSIPESHYTKSIQTFRLFSRTYSSLRGFPFWEILGYWFHVSEYWRSQPIQRRGEEVGPIFEILPNGIARLKNPSRKLAFFRLRPLRRLAPDTVVSLSPTPDCRDDTLLVGFHIPGPHPLQPSQELYVCLVNVNGGWGTLKIDFLCQNSEDARVLPKDVDMGVIREEFTNDMKAFATRWTEQDTEELLRFIPRPAFADPVFRSVESIARASSLCQKFSLSVVLLRALILHHFNYIRIHHRNKVNPSL